MNKRTFWDETAPSFSYPHLFGGMKADVCIIGGGISGVSIAHALAVVGTKVILLEKDAIGNGETHRSSAHLSAALDDGLANIARLFGEDGLQTAINSHLKAIDHIEHVVHNRNIDCGFTRVPGYLFNPVGEMSESFAEDRKLIAEMGFTHIRPCTSPFPQAQTGAALCFHGEAMFHPLKYMAQLLKDIFDFGGRVFTHSPALDIQGNGPFQVITPEGRVFVPHVVIATHIPFIEGYLSDRIVPYRSYVITATCPRGALAPGLYCDTVEPYHHLRVCPYTAEEDILLAGGADHRAEEGEIAKDEQQRLQGIHDWLKRYVPQAGGIRSSWSGKILEPIDHLAYIGRIDPARPGLYTVTGDSGHGLTYATIAGMVITSLIRHGHHPWESLYDPCRALKGNYVDWLKHNMGHLATRIRATAQP